MKSDSIPSTSPTYDLLALARQHAEAQMRRIGRLDPTLFLLGQEAPFRMSLSDLPDRSSIAYFAHVAQLMCVAHGVSTAVLAAATWTFDSVPKGPLDPSVLLAKHPRKRECVMLCVEAIGAVPRYVSLLIVRDKSGRFSGFGEALEPSGPNIGPLGNFLPVKLPSDRQRFTARMTLEANGLVRLVSPLNRKFSRN